MESHYEDYVGTGIAAGLVFLLTFLIKLRTSSPKNSNPTNTEPSFARDTVVIHQPLGRGPRAPSICSFALKLETYLRMAGIPYTNHYNTHLTENSTHWISYNGEVISASCVEYLNEVLDKNPNSILSEKEEAVSRAFQTMVEENLYWSLCALMLDENCTTLRSLFDSSDASNLWHSFKLMHQTALGRLKSPAAQRRNLSETINVGLADLRALSTYLDTKPFLMGEQPCETDCTVFGVLAQIKWHLTGSPLETVMTNEYPNLSEYCTRMKELYWPDWDDNITAQC